MCFFIEAELFLASRKMSNEYENFEAVRRTIQDLLYASKKGCSLHQLMIKYKHTTGREIPYESFGHPSTMSLLESMPKLVSIAKGKNGTWLTATPRNLDTHSQTPCSSTSKVTEVKPSLKKQLANLMLSYPNGLRLADLQEAFARRFSFYFSFREYGFSTLAELIKSIPDVLRLEVTSSKGLVIYAASEDVMHTSRISWTKLAKDRKTLKSKQSKSIA